MCVGKCKSSECASEHSVSQSAKRKKGGERASKRDIEVKERDSDTEKRGNP